MIDKTVNTLTENDNDSVISNDDDSESSDDETERAVIGEVYWGKSGSYPYWPCLIIDGSRLLAKYKKQIYSRNGQKASVMFFGDYQFASVDFNKLHKWGEEPLHSEFIDQKLSSKENLKNAVEVAMETLEEKVADRLAIELEPHMKLSAVEKERFTEWSELQTRLDCNTCGKTDNDECMLLCDGLYCNRSYHTTCLTPALTSIPSGDWICPRCEPPTIDKNKKKQKSITRPNKKSKKNKTADTMKEKTEASGEKRKRVLLFVKNLVKSINKIEVDYEECKDLMVDDDKVIKKKRDRLSETDLKRNKKKAKKEKEYRKLKKIMESESDSSDSDEEVDAVKQTLRDMKKLKLDLVNACKKEPCNYIEIKGLLREMSKMRDLTIGILKISGIVKELQTFKSHKVEKVGKLCEKLINYWKEKFTSEKKKTPKLTYPSGSTQNKERNTVYSTKRKASSTPAKMKETNKRVKIEVIPTLEVKTTVAQTKPKSDSVKEAIISIKTDEVLDLFEIPLEDSSISFKQEVILDNVRKNMIQTLGNCLDDCNGIGYSMILKLEKTAFDKHGSDNMIYQTVLRKVRLQLQVNMSIKEAVMKGSTATLARLI